MTASGATLLGADNKAGVAEIVAAAEYLMKHPEIPHGAIRVGFTPDEEVGARNEVLRRQEVRRRLRLHDGRRDQGRDRDGNLVRRRDHDQLPGQQHASRLRQGEDDQRHQGRGGFHQPPPQGPALAGDDGGVRRIRAPLRRQRVGREDLGEAPPPRLQDGEAAGAGGDPHEARATRPCPPGPAPPSSSKSKSRTAT